MLPLPPSSWQSECDVILQRLLQDLVVVLELVSFFASLRELAFCLFQHTLQCFNDAADVTLIGSGIWCTNINVLIRLPAVWMRAVSFAPVLALRAETCTRTFKYWTTAPSF